MKAPTPAHYFFWAVLCGISGVCLLFGGYFAFVAHQKVIGVIAFLGVLMFAFLIWHNVTNGRALLASKESPKAEQ